MGEEDLKDLVFQVGKQLRRAEDDVEPYFTILLDNWFDTPDSVLKAKPEELSSLGIPLRFVKELIAAAETAGAPVDAPPANDGRGSRQRSRSPPQRGEKERPKGGGKAKGKSKRDKGDVFDNPDDWQCPNEDCVHHDSLVFARHDSCPKCHTRRPDDRTVTTRSAEGKGGGKGKDNGAKGKDRDRKGKGEGRRSRSRDRGKGSGRAPECRHELELENTEGDFPLRSKLLGEKGHNVHHIEDHCRAKVNVSQHDRNRPMRVEITAENSKDLDKAVNMTEDLIGAVMDEYHAHLEAPANGDDRGRQRKGGKAKGHGKDKGGKDRDNNRDHDRGHDRERDRDDRKGGKEGGKGGGKDKRGDKLTSCEFKKALKLKPTEQGFNLRATLVGSGGVNVHHIEDETNAKINFNGEGGPDGMRVEIGAENADDLERADTMVKDLIRTAYAKYAEWKDGGGEREKEERDEIPRRDKGKGGKGGKGKGKRSRPDDREPSEKRRRY